MKFTRGFSNLADQAQAHGCVLTIGNFDGVHRGHQAVLAQLADVSATVDAPAWLMTFEPHPREFFAPDQRPPRLTRLAEKIQLLRQTALDTMLCLHFTRCFSQMSADEFIEQLLVARLGVRALIVGADFRFGRGGLGDVALLNAAGEKFGFSVHDCATYTENGQRVSSSWVRQALADGDLALAERLLGRRYRIAGRVAHGDQLGRTIGFPTANVTVGRRSVALSGVFAVWFHRVAKAPLPGVANVGVRPTVDGRQLRVEVHLLGFSGDLYGHPCEVEFVERLRPEQRFDSLPALQEQIQRDVAAARTLFGAR